MDYLSVVDGLQGCNTTGGGRKI